MLKKTIYTDEALFDFMGQLHFDRYVQVRELAHFLALRDELPPAADFLMVLGSKDLQVPECAARFFLEHQKNISYVITSGGLGKESRQVMGHRAEAIYFKELMVSYGIDPARFIVETNSMHTGDNMQKSFPLLLEKPFDNHAIVIMQTPLRQRRAMVSWSAYAHDAVMRRQDHSLLLDMRAYSYAPYLPDLFNMIDTVYVSEPRYQEFLSLTSFAESLFVVNDVAGYKDISFRSDYVAHVEKLSCSDDLKQELIYHWLIAKSLAFEDSVWLELDKLICCPFLPGFLMDRTEFDKQTVALVAQLFSKRIALMPEERLVHYVELQKIVN